MDLTGSPARRLSLNGLLCSFLLLLAATAAAQTGALIESEELTYNVRYAFFDLGQVRITTRGRTTMAGRNVTYAKAFIDSYSGVPFADLHATFESWIDSAFVPRMFVGKSKDGKVWEYSRYHFDYERGEVLIEGGRRDTIVEKRDTIGLSEPVQDGLSLFFFARDRLRSGRRMNVPCVIREEKVNTFLDFPDTRTSVEVDAIPYPVDVIQFEGTLEFAGIFGLTGDFEGWFSNDDARVPIKATMEVIIGNITIELMEWKREGWTAPRGSE